MGDGDRFAIDTAADFVVCVNYLGSPTAPRPPWFAIPNSQRRVVRPRLSLTVQHTR